MARRWPPPLVACALRYNQAIVSHVGDSRCYLVRNGSARQITEDHTWVNQQRKLGIITASEMAESEARHILIRSLGPEMFVAPDTTALDLYAGDVLVLCSDGLHDEMSEEAIAAIASQEKDPGEIARELVARAVEIDGNDNTTAQVIRVLSVERMSTMPRGRPLPVDGLIRPLSKALTKPLLFPSRSSDRIERRLLRWSMPQNGFSRHAWKPVRRSIPTASMRRLPAAAWLLSIAPPTCATTARSPSRFPTPTWKPIPFSSTAFSASPASAKNSAIPRSCASLAARSAPASTWSWSGARAVSCARFSTKARSPRTAPSASPSAILDALEYIHANGVVHRDLKPENIMVDAEDNIKLIDFGIASDSAARRLTYANFTATLGTPDYIAPEQVKGKRGDGRTDIYAMGVILYEMLSGKLPFSGPSPLAVMNDRLLNHPTAAPRRQPCHLARVAGGPLPRTGAGSQKSLRKGARFCLGSAAPGPGGRRGPRRVAAAGTSANPSNSRKILYYSGPGAHPGGHSAADGPGRASPVDTRFPPLS